MEAVLPIVITLVLILLNGLFVAAEFAIIGVPRSTIERLASEGNAVARKVHELLVNPRLQDRYIATAQLGITLASLGLGMYGEHSLAEWLAHIFAGEGFSWLTSLVAAHTIASIVAIAILTYFHIVLGEMVPKTLALMHADRTVLAITRLMLLIQGIFYPFVIGLNAIGNGILKLFGIDRDASSAHFHTAEEIQYVVRESQEGGKLHAEAGEIIQHLFDFGDLTAGEVMIPRVRVKGMRLGSTREELREVLSSSPHTRYPVHAGDLDHIIGVIHVKDVIRLLNSGRPLAERDVHRTAFVPESTMLDGVIQAMRTARTHLVIVMDEHGGTAGVISIEDLCEEAVGVVEDEEGLEASQIRQEPAGHYIVHGLARLDQISEATCIPLEREDVDTLSGLVLAELGRPPLVGDVVLYEGYRIEVLAVLGHGVQECSVTPPAIGDGESGDDE